MIEPCKRAIDRIDKKLKPELQSLMKQYCLKDEVDAMQEGYENEHAKVLEEIKKVSFFGKRTSENPTFFISIGQTGAGKSNLSAEIEKVNKERNIDIVKIDSDKYKAFRADSDEIQKKHLTEYAYLTGPDAYRHRDEMLIEAMNKKYNILFEAAPSEKDGLFIDIDEIRKKGYNIEINVIAVSSLNSLLSIHERYEDQISSSYSGAKLTSIARHDDSYNALNECVLNAHKKGVNINVYRRGTEVPYAPLLVYSKSKDKFNSPIEAINFIRSEDERKTIRNFNNRYSIIKSRMMLRNAPIAQQDQLQQIGELYKTLQEEIDY